MIDNKSGKTFIPPAMDIVCGDVERALCEDLGSIDVAQDVSGNLLAKDSEVEARLYSNSDGLLCGVPWFDTAFILLDKEIKINWRKQDGETINQGDLLCSVTGNIRTLLAGERTALNFIQLLSGVATRSYILAKLVAKHSKKGATTQVLDTRKTIPGLRIAQKYAVRVGGCHNHRFSLYDAILIKENHILGADSIKHLLENATKQGHGKRLPIIVEVETLQELQEVLNLISNNSEIRVDVILLDNLDLEQIKQALELREKIVSQMTGAGAQPAFEISGMIDEKNLPTFIELGVERISMGYLTKDIKTLDFSLQFK